MSSDLIINAPRKSDLLLLCRLRCRNLPRDLQKDECESLKNHIFCNFFVKNNYKQKITVNTGTVNFNELRLDNKVVCTAFKAFCFTKENFKFSKFRASRSRYLTASLIGRLRHFSNSSSSLFVARLTCMALTSSQQRFSRMFLTDRLATP